MSERRERRRKRIRKKIFGTNTRPRLSVYRSLNYIYAQLIDDINSSTILSFSTPQLKNEKLNRMDAARECGRILAQMAKEKGIEMVVFDRSGYKYHGRVKAFAEGAKEGGLAF